MRICFVFAFLLSITSCRYFSKNAQPEKDLLAVVADEKLYLKDALQAMPPRLDSTEKDIFINNFTRKWAENQALLIKAELNLTDEQKEVEKQIEKYRASLIIYTYEQKYILQELDTNVDEKEIISYYNENKESFKLKDYIVKARFVKILENAPNLKRIKKWITSSDDEDIDQLEDYCLQYATTFFVEDKWIQFSDLLITIPLEINDNDFFLKHTSYEEIIDVPHNYYLFIYDYRLKGTHSPIEIERQKIINSIVNIRKIKLLKAMKNGVLAEALNSNTAQILIK